MTSSGVKTRKKKDEETDKDMGDSSRWISNWFQTRADDGDGDERRGEMRKENLWGEMMLQDNMNRNDRKGKIQVSSWLVYW